MADITPENVAGCFKGCGFVIAAALVLSVSSSCLTGDDDPPPAAPVPQEEPPQAPDESLCEGEDYIHYDDCKDFEHIPGPR